MAPASGPGQFERGIVALDQALRDLSNPFTLMSIAIRPGEEDLPALIFHRRKLGARTISAFVIGARDDPQRARQALSVAEASGSDLYFLGLDEWPAADRKKALEALVRAIELTRPDCIVVGSRRSHQREALLEFLKEALERAADLDGWSVRRLFQRADSPSELVEGGVTINLAEYDHTRGMTYASMALACAQFYGAGAQPETNLAHYKLIRPLGDKTALGKSLLSGLNLPEKLARALEPPRVGELSLLEAIGQRERLAESLLAKLLEKRAEGPIEDMKSRYGPDYFRMIRFIESLERAAALALGIEFRIELSDRLVVPGQSVELKTSLHNGSDRSLLVAFHVPESLRAQEPEAGHKSSEAIHVSPQSSAFKEFQYRVPDDPTWMAAPPNYYPASGAQLNWLGHLVTAVAEVGLGQVSIFIPAMVEFQLAPPFEIEVEPPLALLSDWSAKRSMQFDVRVRNHTRGSFSGALWVVPLALTRDDYEPAQVSFAQEDEELSVKLELDLPILKPPLSPDILIELRRARPAPPDPLAAAKIQVHLASFDVGDGLKVGCICDRSLWAALSQFQIQREEISPAEPPDLSKFSAVVVSSLDEGLSSLKGRLLEYVRRGGNLIVFQRPELVPFPIELSSDPMRAAAKIINPDHTLIREPNRILEVDLKGELRMTHPAIKWGDQYEAPIVSEGGPAALLMARHGEGIFIYVGFDMSSRLMSGQVGAYRLLANLLSASKAMR
jgi:hypothetical protein